MLLSLLAPETTLGLAFSNFLSARLGVKRMRPFAAEDGVEWSLSHSYFADMGGFFITFRPLGGILTSQPEEEINEETGIDPKSEQKTHENPEEEMEGSIKSAHGSQLGDITSVPLDVYNDTLSFLQPSVLAEQLKRRPNKSKISRQLCRLDKSFSLSAIAKQNRMGPWKSGIADWQVDKTNLRAVQEALVQTIEESSDIGLPRYVHVALLQGDVWVLDALQLHRAREMGIIEKLPDYSSKTLADKDKGDMLLKILAILQILWLAISLLVRQVQGLPSTQLEVMTLAIAILSIVTYGLNIQKPQDVSIPVIIPAARYPTAKEICSITDLQPIGWLNPRLVSNTLALAPETYMLYSSYTMRNNAIHCVFYGQFLSSSGIGGIILGSLHLLAWKSKFPTEIEQTLWRVASFLTIAFPLAICVIPPSTSWLMSLRPKLRSFFMPFNGVLITFCTLTYIFARLYFVVEAFRSLAYLSPADFNDTWPSWVPHIG
jgi:hypothetical protein